LSRAVRITPLAEADIERAQDEYEAREQGLGNRFVKQVRTTLTRIGDNPFQYKSSPTRANIAARRCTSSRSASGIASSRTRASWSRVWPTGRTSRWHSGGPDGQSNPRDSA